MYVIRLSIDYIEYEEDHRDACLKAPSMSREKGDERIGVGMVGLIRVVRTNLTSSCTELDVSDPFRVQGLGRCKPISRIRP